MLLLVFALLPILEIAGFIEIGSRIGVGLSILWVLASILAGVYLLATMGTKTLKKAKKSVNADVYPFEEMFDGFCILVGAFLLIFPGFVSDILALPLLSSIPRGWIFRFLKAQHNSILNDISKSSQGFTSWYYTEKTDGKTTTIEGEFIKVEDDKTLPNK